MTTVAYNLVHPEAYENIVPEAVTQERNQKSWNTFLLISAGIILAGLCFAGYQYWLESQQKKKQS